MKFSYRLIAAAVLAVVILASFLLYSTDRAWNSSKDFKLSSLIGQSLRAVVPMIDTDDDVSNLLAESSNFSVCLNNSEPASADIWTTDFLGQINSKSKPAGRSVRRSNEDSEMFQSSGKKLTVIVVPHSHNDPGWHKTVDGYFRDQTEHTLDFMVSKLLIYPKMTFIWAESVFLSLWWQKLDSKSKDTVKSLIAEGRIEIVVGSWVVPDEANPYYYALVDQMIEGHQWLNDNMNVKPENTWSLDPFGYSSTLPYLYKRAGFDNMVILRVHRELKKLLGEEKALEFMWRQHWDVSGSTDIRTQLMPYQLYNIKHTCGPNHDTCLQFDFRDIPGEISESRAVPITDSNVDRLSKLLLAQYQKKADLFRHNVVLIPIGDDFRFDRSLEWDQQYKNYMKLFNYINRKTEWKVHARFGTLRDYFSELDQAQKDAGEDRNEFPVLAGDFFPYTDRDNAYWTGYFTSRPFTKLLGRELEAQLRTADILNTIAYMMSKTNNKQYAAFQHNMNDLEVAHQSLGLFQHHDAITGTSKSYVTTDNERRLFSAIQSSQTVQANAAEFLMSNGLSTNSQLYTPSKPYNLRSVNKKSELFEVSKALIALNIFNSLAQSRTTLVHLTIDRDMVAVLNKDKKIMPSQINPVWLSDSVIATKEYELVFYITLPALGMETVYIRSALPGEEKHCVAAGVFMYNAASTDPPSNMRFSAMPPGSSYIIIENNSYRARFSPLNGYLQSVTTKDRIITTKIDMEYLMYKSRGSGAYLFNPAGPAVDSEINYKPVVRVVKGPLVSEVHSVQKLIRNVVRLHNTTGLLQSVIEVNNVVDLSNLEDKEMIMRFTMDVTNDNATSFYTDLNGLHMIKRNDYKNLPVPAKYYPMTSMAYVQDELSRFSILTAQPLGVASLERGQVEVMLDRRLLWDDGRGLGEGVLDNRPTPSRFYLMLERKETAIKESLPDENIDPHKRMVSHPTMQAHVVFDMLNNPEVTFMVSNRTDIKLSPQFQAFSQPLPCDSRLVSMRSTYASHTTAVVLHRLGADCSFLKQPLPCVRHAEYNMADMFIKAIVTPKSPRQMTLSLMHHISDIDSQAPLKQNPMELYSYMFDV